MIIVAAEMSYRRVTLGLFLKKVKPGLSFHAQSGLGFGRQVTLIVHSLAWMLKRYRHRKLLTVYGLFVVSFLLNLYFDIVHALSKYFFKFVACFYFSCNHSFDYAEVSLFLC
jgi:uncharacterized membrane protein YczE